MSRPYIGPVVKTRLDPGTLARLDQMAHRAGIARAEALRDIAERALPAVRSCADCKHYNATAVWTCPDAGMDWASEYDVPDTDEPWPDTAPPCPAKEPSP